MPEDDFEAIVAAYDETHPTDDTDQHHLLDEIAHPALTKALQDLADKA